MIIIGANHAQTERLWLDPPDGRQGFEAGSLESLESRGSDVGELKKVEVRRGCSLSRRHTNMQEHTSTLFEVIAPPLCLQLGHDGATPESCWLVDELSVAVPTRGVKYVFSCKCWLAKDRGDGLTSRVFNVLDAEAISISKKVCKCQQIESERWSCGRRHIITLHFDHSAVSETKENDVCKQKI